MRQPLLVVLDLAEHRDHRHQQPGVLQDREGRGVPPVGVRVVARAAPPSTSGGRLAVVAGEAGVGDRRASSAIISAPPAVG